MTDLVKETLSKYDMGLIFVYTGNGKGKTTAAMGQALRAIGHGLKVLMIQFMKGKKYGEVIAAEKYLPDLTIYQCGLDSFVMRKNPAPVDIDLAQQGLNMARKATSSGEYHMVILDEINVAMDFGLISTDDVVDMIKSKAPAVDLILTGRYAPPEIVALADTVSEVHEMKHHYSKGIKERAGIEF
ncbi:MAG: cob(I)yrinic acid a,c-diamide adenosyltransferase [Deltaproteobacteria bacterium]|nr:cob(I)yrinic acid a,c-diamide adenosyltransferase [Deltaproteobacteria bacterium]